MGSPRQQAPANLSRNENSHEQFLIFSFFLLKAFRVYWIYLGVCCELNWRAYMPMGIQFPCLITFCYLPVNIQMFILTVFHFVPMKQDMVCSKETLIFSTIFSNLCFCTFAKLKAQKLMKSKLSNFAWTVYWYLSVFCQMEFLEMQADLIL